jgi:hypothetical protein
VTDLAAVEAGATSWSSFSRASIAAWSSLAGFEGLLPGPGEFDLKSVAVHIFLVHFPNCFLGFVGGFVGLNSNNNIFYHKKVLAFPGEILHLPVLLKAPFHVVLFLFLGKPSHVNPATFFGLRTRPRRRHYFIFKNNKNINIS